jgi:hypothetical protein
MGTRARKEGGAEKMIEKKEPEIIKKLKLYIIQKYEECKKMNVIDRPKICENCGYCEETYDSKEDRQYFQCVQDMKETGLHDTCEFFTPNSKLFED